MFAYDRRRRCSQRSGTQRRLPDQKIAPRQIQGKSDAHFIFLTSTVYFTMSSYRLDRLLMIISLVQVSQKLRDAVRKKRRYKWQGEWFLHHNNAPSHTSLVLQQFLSEKSTPVITQSPYSPDLAPSDFWLFPTLKMGPKRTGFTTMEDIKSNATAEHRKIPKEAFRRCFQQWQDRVCVCACERVLL